VPSYEYGPVEDAHMILVHTVTSAIRAARAPPRRAPVVAVARGESATY
jgi:hypothetical protein